MHNPLDVQASARPGPALRQSRSARFGLAAAGLSVGALLAGSTIGIVPARAQLAGPDAGVQTPYGRAPLSFADIVDKVKPAVVSISVTSGGGKPTKGSRKLPEGMPDIPEDSPFFDFFFKNMPKEFRNMPQQDRPMQGQGSGFVISADGYAVTNNHVVEGANKIQVSFDGQEKFDAELIGTDPRTDVALIKIKTNKPLPTVKFSSKPVRVGDWALAVGNPFGLGGTVTAGIVSALARDINPGPYDFIQIDAAVNKGNSGGPTFNLDGEVIGMNTAIYSPSGGNVGIAFAVPARTAMDVVDQLKKSGSVSRGWLGVKIQNIDEDTAAALGLAEPHGALVSEVTPDGPAAGAGLKVQDAIVAVNGEKIHDSKDLSRRIADFAPATSVDVKVWRGSKEELVKVKLGKFPGSSEEIAKLEQGGPADKEEDNVVEVSQLGLKLGSAKPDDDEGVVIGEVASNSDAAEKGLKAGDVILKVDGQNVAKPEDVVDIVAKVEKDGKKAVMFQVKTADQKRVVPLRFGKQG